MFLEPRHYAHKQVLPFSLFLGTERLPIKPGFQFLGDRLSQTLLKSGNGIIPPEESAINCCPSGELHNVPYSLGDGLESPVRHSLIRALFTDIFSKN